MLPSASLPVIAAAIGNFSPAKSPVYATVASASAASLIICNGMPEDTAHWKLVAIPLFCFIFLLILLSFRIQPTFTSEEYQDSLRFSRSVGMSTAFIALSVASIQTAGHDIFWASYICCLIQAITFFLYSYARSMKDEHKEDEEDRDDEPHINYVQFVLITSTLLLAASFAAMASTTENSHIKGFEEARFVVTSGVLYMFWACCMLFWIKYLASIIHLRVTIPE